MDKHNRVTLLDHVNDPADLRGMNMEELKQLADELRRDLIEVVSVTGGHLGASLGVIELTVALHHTFDTPRDRLIWDVSHQCYPHKMLTGRRDRMLKSSPGRRPQRLHPPGRKRLRPVRRRAQFHLDLRRPRHGCGE